MSGARIPSRPSVEEAADQLADEGYPSVGPHWRTTYELARLVCRAWKANALVWTDKGIRTFCHPEISLTR